MNSTNKKTVTAASTVDVSSTNGNNAGPGDTEDTNELVQLHFAALPSDGPITVQHVHQILGVGNHTEEELNECFEKLQDMKSSVRTWGATNIRAKMTEIARKLHTNDLTLAVVYHNNPVSNFGEIKKWWQQLEVQSDDRARNSMYFICYGYFEENPEWEIFLETQYMGDHKWVYTQQSKDSIQSKNRRKGYQIKGCVARNLANVKHELVKQLQKAGRENKSFHRFTKSRTKDDTIQLESKRRKKGEFYYKSTTSPVKKSEAASQQETNTMVTMFLPNKMVLILEAMLTICSFFHSFVKLLYKETHKEAFVDVTETVLASTNFFKELKQMKGKAQCHPTSVAESKEDTPPTAQRNPTTDNAVKEKPKTKGKKKPPKGTTIIEEEAAEEKPYEPSEYEKLVAEKRQRNLEKLQELGLCKPKEVVKKAKKKEEVNANKYLNENKVVEEVCI